MKSDNERTGSFRTASAEETRRTLEGLERNVSGALRDVLEGLAQDRERGRGRGRGSGAGEGGEGSQGSEQQAVREAACEAVCGMLCTGAVRERGDCAACVGLLLGELDIVGAGAAGRMSDAIVESCVGGGAEELWKRSAAPGCQLKLLQKCLAVADLGGEDAAPPDSQQEKEVDEDDEEEEEDGGEGESESDGANSPSIITDHDDNNNDDDDGDDNDSEEGLNGNTNTRNNNNNKNKKRGRRRKTDIATQRQGEAKEKKRKGKKKSHTKKGNAKKARNGAWTERAVRRLCCGAWPRAGLQAIVHEVAGLALDRGQRERVARKAVECLGACGRGVLFGYAFELLCLCGGSAGSTATMPAAAAAGGGRRESVEAIVMAGLTRHVRGAEAELVRAGALGRDVDAEGAELREAEGSVIFAASLVASQDEGLAAGLAQVVREDRRLATPFALAALLAISGSPRLEAQAYDALRGLIADAQRQTARGSTPWARMFQEKKKSEKEKKKMGNMDDDDDENDNDDEIDDDKTGALERAFEEVAELSAQHWDFTTGPLTKFGFHLIDHAYAGSGCCSSNNGVAARFGGRAGAAGGVEARVGRAVLRRLFVGHEANVKGAILEQICGRIATAAPGAAACYVDVLEALVAENPSGVLSLSSKFRGLIECVGRLPAHAAERFLGAILPLLAVDKGLLDVAVIALRKALFGKGGNNNINNNNSNNNNNNGGYNDGRRAACAGLCQVLRAVCAGGVPGEDGAAGSLSQSLSQSRFGTGGVEAAERGVLLHEVFGLLRRALGQQGCVRAQVYASLADAAAAAPGLAPQAAALLYQHLCAFCPCLCADGDGDDGGGDGDSAWPVLVEGVVWGDGDGDGGGCDSDGGCVEPVPLLVAALGRVSKQLAAPHEAEEAYSSSSTNISNNGSAEERAGRAVRAAVECLAERVAGLDPVCVAGFVDGGAEWKRGVCRLYRGVCCALIECLLCTCGEDGLSPRSAAVQAVIRLDRRAAALGNYMAAVGAGACEAKQQQQKKKTKKRKKAKKKKKNVRRVSKRCGGDDEEEDDDASDEEDKEEENEEDDSDEGDDDEISAEPPKKVARRGRAPASATSSSSGDGEMWQWAGQALLSLESVKMLAAGMEGGEGEGEGEGSESGEGIWDDEEGMRRLVVGSALWHLRRISREPNSVHASTAAAAEFCLYVGARLFARYLAPLLSEQPHPSARREGEEAEAAGGCEAVRLCVAFFAKHGSPAELCEFLRACIGDVEQDPEQDPEQEPDQYGTDNDEDDGRRDRERPAPSVEDSTHAIDFYAKSFDIILQRLVSQEGFDSAIAVCGVLETLYAYLPADCMRHHSLWLRGLLDNEIRNTNVLKEVVSLYIRAGQDITGESQNACMVIALSLHRCLNGANAEESDHEDENDDGSTLGAVTQHTGATVLGVLLSSGESLVNEAEAAITNNLGRRGVEREAVYRAVVCLAEWVTVVSQTRIQQTGRVRLVRLLGGLYKLGALLLRDLVKLGVTSSSSSSSSPKLSETSPNNRNVPQMPSAEAVGALVSSIGAGMDAHTAFATSYMNGSGSSTRSRIAADSRAVPQLFYAAELFRGEVLKAKKRLGKAYDFVECLPRSKARDFRVTWKELDRRISEREEAAAAIAAAAEYGDDNNDNNSDE